ncbi:hypothetical protein HMPREF1624_04841 [Sporothrix schenckii ATCC 58251]|uniref:Nonsense-mediated mRNA decay factor n=1 Tax=Sporothrix schenckii (strain ATCC 58251 / de Perez 2211183) TaxID=1391915 RepID=U7PQZ3_SPOS1|nr:hypothetical protein HMPREF1624_04841 [Sporothrix schenckii ATCC 58251]
MAATNSNMAAGLEASEAEQHWLEAKKTIHSMVKKLEQIDKDEAGSKKLLAELESVEHMLESLRLACMATTFTDFKFSHNNRVLDRLWHVHTLISTEYKKGLQRHRGQGQIVQFRTIEKQYAKHLKTAQYFYKGFIERLSARYRLRSLQRVAHAMQSGNLKISDVIDADEAHLSDELTMACYRTVLHMGDISRYRLNASRQKGHNPDVAMTYYALAQDLMPQEGDAHHQMAVVLAEQRRDFDVVYHFLRSWSVQKPFPLAPKNLASEFKKLLQPPSNSRKTGNAPPDAHDLFGTWLVRLHANYFKGEEFSSQGELEREVLHRWEALLRQSAQPAYLQKAVLMNIAAYDIALKRVQYEWTAASSQSCQFILQFIVRTILVLSRVLETETQRFFEETALEDEPEAVPTPATPASAKKTSPTPAEKGDKSDKNSRHNGRNRGGNSNNNNTNAKKPTDTDVQKQSVSDTCLSLFRVCVAWIATHYEDLVKFEGHLTPYIADMHRSVTRCLNLFVELITKTEASPTTYLLPEDVEVIGLATLDGWTALRESDANSAFKPRFDEEGVERKSSTYETMARIYDVVECTVRLIGDPSFPWVIENAQEDGRNVTKISYSEDRTSAPAPAIPLMSIPATASMVSASYAAASATPSSASPAPAIKRQAPSSDRSREPRNRGQRPAEVTQSVPAEAAPVATAAQFGQPTISLPINGLVNVSHPADSRPMPPPRRVSYKDMDDDDFLPGSMKEPPFMPLNRIAAAPIGTGHDPTTTTTDSELDFLESAAYSRVANFLTPPELNPQPPQVAAAHNMSPSSPSFGMHSSTVDDVFGQLQTPSMPNASSSMSPAAKPIPSSPWAGSSYMHSLGYYPQQQQQQQQQQQKQQMSYSMSNMDRQPTSIEDQLAYLTLAKEQERQMTTAAAAASAAGVQMQTSSSSYGIDSSRGFPSALSPVGAAKQQHHSPNGGGPAGFANPWATTGGGGAIGGNPNGSRLRPQQLQQAQAASLGVGGAVGAVGGIGLGLGGMSNQPAPGSSPAMLYSSNFSMNNSMPSVQSSRAPGGGSGVFDSSYESIYGSRGTDNDYQMQQQQQLQQLHILQQHHQQQQQQQQQLAAYGGYGDFNVADDRIIGSGSSAPIASPSSNAMWQDAATAWGRGMPLGKDDPTHFRNTMRQSGLMEDTNAYDRNALLSALDEEAGSAQPR